jgi:hypothetical protein
MQYPTGTDPASKVHYRPLEAAIRWSGLEQHEQQILSALQQKCIPDPGDFPQWPTLHLNAERIFDALRNGELPYGVNGVSAPPGTALDHPALTVRHVHLKAWMQHYYPDQRPSFLFSVFERSVHPVITIDDVRALTFERDSLKSLLTERDAEIDALRLELRALLKSLDTGSSQNAPPRLNSSSVESLSARAETVYLHIIGGQNALLLGKDESGKSHTRFRTQEEVIAALTDRYDGRLGMTKSTLENKFALANRTLSDKQ